MKTKSAALLLCGLLFATQQAWAHHSFAAVFDGTKPVNVTGKLVRVEWTNPHIWFYIEVPDEKGIVTTWGFSAAPPGVLMRRGIPKDVLKIGSMIHVEGFRARDGSNNASGGTVTFSDGRKVFTASNEDAVPQSEKR